MTSRTAPVALLQAVERFAAKLRYETDPADVRPRGWGALRPRRQPGRRGLGSGTHPGSRASADGADPRSGTGVARSRHARRRVVPGPRSRFRRAAKAAWRPCDGEGPGCNGSAKAALALARLGYPVRAMIGGFEYWAREGLPVVDDTGPVVRVADPLTAPVHALVCDC